MAAKDKTFAEDHIDGFSILKFREVLVAAISAAVLLCGVAWGFYEFMQAETAQQAKNQNQLVEHDQRIMANSDQITDIKDDLKAKASKAQLDQHLNEDQREKNLIWRQIEKP